MPKKKTPELDPKEQFKRFQEAAKKAGVDADESELAFAKISRKPNVHSADSLDIDRKK